MRIILQFNSNCVDIGNDSLSAACAMLYLYHSANGAANEENSLNLLNSGICFFLFENGVILAGRYSAAFATSVKLLLTLTDITRAANALYQGEKKHYEREMLIKV